MTFSGRRRAVSWHVVGWSATWNEAGWTDRRSAMAGRGVIGAVT